MTEQQVRAVPTLVSLPEYLAAVEGTWPKIVGEPCSRSACSVLYAQYWIETGGRACFNWNLGNVKHFDRDGFDYFCLNNVEESVTPSEARRLIALGEAVLTAKPKIAVGPGKVCVTFNPPHPQTRFRSFASLADGMEEHLRLLRKRFASAWHYIVIGDYRSFAYALKAQRYFTADPMAYADGMRPAFERAMTYDASSQDFDLRGPKGLQAALSRLGYDPGPADGVVGPRTLAAVRRFQGDRGLLVDGVVGPITRAALANALDAVTEDSA